MNMNDTTGINQAQQVLAQQTQLTEAEAKQRRNERLKAGAIGTAKAVGYMAVGAAVAVGVQKYQSSRNNQQDNQQGQ